MPLPTSPPDGTDLWWVTTTGLTVLESQAGSSASIDLRLGSAIGPVGLSVLASFAFLGAAAACSGVLVVSMSPLSALSWLIAVVGVGLGGTIAWLSTAFVVQDLVHLAWRSRVHSVADELVVEVWNTWNGGPISGFRRCSGRFGRAELAGVALAKGQGGQTQLFVLHRCGQGFFVGDTARAEDALRMAGQLSGWISRQS